MKAKIITIFFACILVQTAFSQQVFTTETGTASFTSDAPLELIKAKSDQLQGIINLSDRSFTFTIYNRSFTGFNSKLQREHFYENYMEVEDNPVSTFKGKIIEEIDINSREPQVVRAKGILDIHGIEQERIIKGTIKLTGDAIEVNADFTILLADHHIKIPRVVYQKIAEVIDVNVTAELTKKIN